LSLTNTSKAVEDDLFPTAITTEVFAYLLELVVPRDEEGSLDRCSNETEY
jgi:hypothetical protein